MQRANLQEVIRRRIMQMAATGLRSFCTTGLVLGTLFFAASLTPSLIPRGATVQGVLGGAAFAFGYLTGVVLRALWHFLALPEARPSHIRRARLTAIVICLVIAVAFLQMAPGWQNGVRAAMNMEPVDGVHSFRIVGIALAVFVLSVIIARLFSRAGHGLARLMTRLMPPRVAALTGFAIMGLLVWTLANGLLLSAGLRLADTSFRQLDAFIPDELTAPANPLVSGSSQSHIGWMELGRAGRNFVSGVTPFGELAAYHTEGAKAPIRLYVGLAAGETIEDRARLALAEMQRTGAFDREILVIVTPTGTGMIDPDAIRSLEYLTAGDVATVAVQYSYMASWLTLLVEPEYGADSARAVFATIYDYWRELPRDERPQLYLHGLSLGSMNSDLSADLFDVIGDPYQGALWSGPPFPSRTWNTATRERRPGSPAWLPRFRDGSVIRFANQYGFGEPNLPERDFAAWGPLRIVYLQYASDPITFFSPQIAWRRPDWLNAPRGPDVSPELRWIPVVTMLQLFADIISARAAPLGHGHFYAPEHYVTAWHAVIEFDRWQDGPRWDGRSLERLRRHLIATR